MEDSMLEKRAGEVQRLLPKSCVERTRDVFQITDEFVVVLVTREALELRLPTVEWTTPGLPVESSRLWRRLSWKRADGAGLKKIIAEAQETRKKEFLPCQHCGEPTPPEHRHGKTCHGCAERIDGIVH